MKSYVKRACPICGLYDGFHAPTGHGVTREPDRAWKAGEEPSWSGIPLHREAQNLRTWALPKEPEADVTDLVDADGLTWHRGQTYVNWIGLDGVQVAWHWLITNRPGPLTEVLAKVDLMDIKIELLPEVELAYCSDCGSETVEVRRLALDNGAILGTYAQCIECGWDSHQVELEESGN